MDVVAFVIGGALLLFGRLLYWILVGVVGFFLGQYIATNLLQGEPALITLIGVVGGILGIAMAYVLQYMAVGLAGFALGGYLFTQLIDILNFNVGGYEWIAFITGGVVGVMLVGFIFEWSLIILSTLAGAALIVEQLPVEGDTYFLVYFGLVMLGIIIQSLVRWSQRARKEEDQE